MAPATPLDPAVRRELIGIVGLMPDRIGALATWTDHSELLLGLPAYDDAGVGYHDPRVENLDNALRGVNAALFALGPRATRASGIAIYADWTTSPADWSIFERRFRSPPARPASATPR